MAMLLNGRPYADDDIQSPRANPGRYAIKLIEIYHDSGGIGGMGMGRGMGMMGGMGGMMSMAHPIHLHGQQFQILSRGFDDDAPDSCATMREGFVISGWKDTALVTPGERVRIISRSEISRACLCTTVTISNTRTWA